MRDAENRNSVKCKNDKIKKMTEAKTTKTRGCGRWGAARYGAVLAVEYVRAVFLGYSVFALSGAPRGTNGRTDGGNGRCHGNEVSRGKAARGPYDTCQIWSWSDNRQRSYGDLSPITQLAAVTLTSDPLTLKLVHGVLVSQGPFLPSLVFVGLFVFPLGGGTGQTDRQTDRRTGSIHDGASF